ncbi:glycosyltransferase family 2 protein [Hyphomicrobium sp.]|jgi:cellulose synthase/poly-beta-1,6-N-acetylglucosamine synthase-like glycosyltransferase|uniref:glycosyltransferase family 2 protein n=1 Tax=Hyphomicrobium sp. TaxID=82 RepID=UPI002C22265B|nr:glycosyltransferase family 2 protein [Hyphomicrobium sp.]HVZ04299.1 glycosyltransferase family 2 protein [Hyphomicrobium sp.]
MDTLLSILNAAFLIAGAATLVPVATLGLQIACSCIPLRTRKPSGTERPPVAVIIPAHNEQSGIARTINSIREQLKPSDRMILIADNCTDDTADVARGLGAEVVVRADRTKIGKGYALDAGVKYLLSSDAPEIVLFVDADCVLAPDAITSLAHACATQDRPIQGLYLMTLPEEANIRQRISAFAWSVKNDLRPRGYYRLGMPCLLMGTGMALPIHLLDRLSLATDHITEDTVIGLKCALMGKPPAFCPDAVITSEFAPTESGREIQKSRWIHGQLSALFELGPLLVVAALRRRDPRLLALAADTSVVPLGFLLIFVATLNLATLCWFAATGHLWPLVLSVTSLVIAALALIAAWIKTGRNLLRLREIPDILRHAARQLVVIKDYVVGQRARWIRSERGH